MQVIFLFTLFSLSTFACQIVCSQKGHPGIILCDDTPTSFRLIIDYQDPETKKYYSVDLIEKIDCHIDKEDDRIVSCPKTNPPGGVSVKTRLIEQTAVSLDRVSGNREENPPKQFLEFDIYTEKVEELPSWLTKSDKGWLKVVFDLSKASCTNKKQNL